MTTTEGRVSMVTPADHVRGAKQGQWTYKDYAALPDDGQRYEIIDGVLYMAPSPNEWHQSAVGEFFSYLRTYVKLAGLGRVYFAPFDVELAYNVVVQPDVLVVLNENLSKIIPSRVIGAPDLVVEVASPGTATHDRRKKQDAYARAGVPEYWIADPAARTIEVFTLEGTAYRSLGVFEGPAILPSLVIPTFPVQVKQFFA
jgi:Uma2 family endonuclease